MPNLSASWGLQFIVAVMRSGSYGAIAHHKITAELLRPEERPLLEYIIAYYENRRTYGSLPPMELLIDRFPHLGLPDITPTHGDLSVLADMIHREKLKGVLTIEGLNLSRLAESDPFSALARLQQLAYQMTQAHGPGGQDLLLSEAAERVGRELRIVLDSGGLLGIPWVWEALNTVTMGIRRGDMIGLYGRPKSMKSHLKILQSIYTYESGRRVLWVNTEMTKEQVELRVALAMQRWDYGAVRNRPTLQLIEHLEEELRSLRGIEEWEARVAGTNREKFFIITDDIHNPAELRAKIEELQPDLVVVDTANEMDDDQGAKRDNQRQANVARALRKITRDERLGKPAVLYSIHANREGEKEIAYGYREVGGTDQWGKSSDLLIRVIRLKNQDGRWVLAMLPPAGGGREVVWEGMLVGTGAYHNMGYIRDTTRDEVVEMIKLSRGDEDAPRPTGGSRRRVRTPVDNTPNEAPALRAGWAQQE